MTKSRFRGALSVSILGLFVTASASASELVWIARMCSAEGVPAICDGIAPPWVVVYNEAGTPVGSTSSIPGPIGGMTRVGNELWVGLDDTNEIFRLDFSGNVLGTIPAFTTESTGGLTRVDDEIWWGSGESTTILRLDLSGTVLGSIDGGFLNLGPTGGMVRIGDEVWRGPKDPSVLGGALLRFDLAGNWLGTMSDPQPGLLPPPEDEGTASMTRVGSEVWWAEEPALAGVGDPLIYKLDASGTPLGTVPVGSPGDLPYRRGMATVPGPVEVPSMHPIAAYVLLSGLLVGVGLVGMRRRLRCRT